MRSLIETCSTWLNIQNELTWALKEGQRSRFAFHTHLFSSCSMLHADDIPGTCPWPELTGLSSRESRQPQSSSAGVRDSAQEARLSLPAGVEWRLPGRPHLN
jgi:hypothetical protein